jgi:hypothetical protein
MGLPDVGLRRARWSLAIPLKQAGPAPPSGEKGGRRSTKVQDNRTAIPECRAEGRNMRGRIAPHVTVGKIRRNTLRAGSIVGRMTDRVIPHSATHAMPAAPTRRGNDRPAPRLPANGGTSCWSSALRVLEDEALVRKLEQRKWSWWEGALSGTDNVGIPWVSLLAFLCGGPDLGRFCPLPGRKPSVRFALTCRWSGSVRR